jgi:hypothetical protein
VKDKRVALEHGLVKTGTALATIGGAYEQPAEPRPFTPELHLKMQAAVDHFKVLIGVRSDAHLTFAPKANSAGHFAADRYVGLDGASIAPHQINLNPDHFVDETDKEVASTLAHELVHLWRHENGPPLKRAYHDKLWAAKMKSIGLMPSSTGAPGGRETGAKVSHYILAGGPFEQAFAELQASGWQLPLQSAPRRGQTKGPNSKTKFMCPGCDRKVWGKPDTEVWCKRCSLELKLPIDMIAEGAADDLAQAAE